MVAFNNSPQGGKILSQQKHDPEMLVIQESTGINGLIGREYRIAFETARVCKTLAGLGLEAAKYLTHWDICLTAINALETKRYFSLPIPPLSDEDSIDSTRLIASPDESPLLFHHLIHKQIVRSSAHPENINSNIQLNSINFDYREYLSFLSLMQETANLIKSNHEQFESSLVNILADSLILDYRLDSLHFKFSNSLTIHSPVFDILNERFHIDGPISNTYGFCHKIYLQHDPIRTLLSSSDTILLMNPGLDLAPSLKNLKSSPLRFQIDESSDFSRKVLQNIITQLGIENIEVLEDSSAPANKISCMLVLSTTNYSGKEIARACTLAHDYLKSGPTVLLASEPSNLFCSDVPGQLEVALTNSGFRVSNKSVGTVPSSGFTNVSDPLSLRYIDAHDLIIKYIAKTPTTRVNSLILSPEAA